MIVKNETHIVKECLSSMLPYIDRYDITDTGSDDGTPELIEQFIKKGIDREACNLGASYVLCGLT